MKIAVAGNQTSFNALCAPLASIEWVRVENTDAFKNHPDAAAYFNLTDNATVPDQWDHNIPVFINNVIEPFGHKQNHIRINGWPGFLENDSWEIAGDVNDNALKVLSALKKKPIITKDEPGFISARIIAMIINEAYYAIAEKVSTEKEIDIAMKLGTNYPYGPFEWAQKIGLKNIYDLLVKLSLKDNRYLPSPTILNLINSQ